MTTPGLSLRPDVFAIFAAFVEERSGIHYRPTDRELVEDRLVGCAMDAGFDSLLDYYHSLRYDDADGSALKRLLERLVVHETYFFREILALSVVTKHVLAPLVARGLRPRVWSAACSTGEEPLTLAILLREAGFADSVDIVASDLSENVLAKARAGTHSIRSVRTGAPQPLVDRWLSVDTTSVRVKDNLAASIDFRKVNLVDPGAVAELGSFDVVLCRNVLIYFKDATVCRIVDTLARSLRPNGVLVVGVSESLLRFDSPLRCEEIGGSFVYRKVAEL